MVEFEDYKPGKHKTVDRYWFDGDKKVLYKQTKKDKWEKVNDVGPEVQSVAETPLNKMTKLELDNYALDKYGFELDRRETKEHMLEEFNELLTAGRKKE